VDVRASYDPVHELPACRAFATVGALETTADLASRITALPLATDMSVEQLTKIVDVVSSAARAALAPAD
jgi:dTDP-4-amino-4,6-dideoxygalactose transaminase